MKKNKSKTESRGEDFQLDKLLIAKLIVAVVLVSFGIAIFQHLKRSEYFRVNEITIRQSGNITQDEKNFSYLKRRNIFDLDLDKEARNAAYYYPSYQKIRITRFFPSHLVVDFLKRDAQACIRASRTFYIDDNLILFELPQEAAEPRLPVITGVDRDVLGAKYGSRINSPAITTAMNIIKAAKGNKVFKGYEIKRVDMSGPGNNASIILLVSAPLQDYTKTDFTAPESVMEVKVGREDIHNKLTLLATLLAQVKNNIHNIEYIDLRFKEPVIKFREKG